MRKQLQLRASAFPKLLWLMLLALLPTQLSARDFEYTYEGQTLTYTVLNEEAKTVQTKAGVYSSGTATPGNSVSGILNIPANVTDESGEQFTVTQIGQNGFPKCEITEIHFPETLTQIRDYAFQDCNQLEEVSLPSSLTTLHNGVFQTASALKSVRFEYSELNLTLGNNVFQNAPIESIYYGRNVNLDKVVSERSSLKSIEISDSLTKIPDSAFQNCTSLTGVIIPNSVTSIGNGAFSGCFRLKKSAYPSNLSNPFPYGEVVKYPAEGVYNYEDGYIWSADKTVLYFVPWIEGELVVPNSVISIGNSAISYCSGLTSVTIPESVTSIGNSAISYCSGLTSVTIPESVTSIGNSAFEYCSGLTSVTIPESVTSIGNSAFEYCSALTSVTIPESVTSIGDEAFRNCSGLTSVTIPNSVTSIGKRVFKDCI